MSMDIMKHKDAVDEIVKTGKAIMSSKNPGEKEALKVIYKYIYITLYMYIYISFFNIIIGRQKLEILLLYFSLKSGQDRESFGEIRHCQSAEFRALSPAGASAVSGWAVLGDLRRNVAMAARNIEHLQPAALACHRI